VRFFIPALLFFLFSFSSFAQEGNPKREFRAVWIATVGNIDWPSKKGLSSQQQQQEFVNYLDFLQATGFNAVIVQVRPAADAFYPSPYEPWSVYLSGKQGQPPFPKYDPLAFMIRETHKRNMEFHAWFNPFRALVNSRINPNPPDHVTRTHPDWIINYGGKAYFDPGNPETRNYILKVIMDVVKRYDIDGVHIDDYFYPYRVPGETFRDNNSFKKYNNGMDLADWRRNNVNLFISQLYNQIKKEKYWVKFGISPFGIWRNEKDDPLGSATNGCSCYDDLYSDVKLWIKNKWLDYVAPQIYWETGNRSAAFDVLLPWWEKNKGERQLYIGLGLYKMVNAPKGSPWSGTAEILKQIRMSRAQHANGVVFYSISNFSKIGPALTDSLKYNYFGTIALPPRMPWLNNIPPRSPVVSVSTDSTGTMLRWNVDNPSGAPLKFLVYRFKKNEKMDLNNSAHILCLTQAHSFLDQENKSGAGFKYAVTALDRLWNESGPGTIER
jgi:uncharacterized lipoprotein YddW (UPF0748 family)